MPIKTPEYFFIFLFLSSSAQVCKMQMAVFLVDCADKEHAQVE